ncbi:MAG: prohibitin family protein [Chloroflexi bacterium]|nr:prohibitin family protein [Chloroflexota bacterium]
MMGGIGGLLGAVAAVAFLLFLGGIGLIVVWSSQNRPVRGLIPLVVIALIAGLGLSLVSQGVIVVEPQQVAVVFQTFTGDLDTPRRSGTHIIVPVLQEATIYPISFQQYTMSGVAEEASRSGDDAVQVRTIDGQEVLLDVTVIYRIDPQNVNIVHERWQNRYEDDLIRPVLRGFVRDAVSGFRAEAVYADSRTVIQEAIEEATRQRLEEEGFEVSDLIIRNVTFSNEEFAQSIERVQIAERQAQEAAFRVQQEEQEAERVRVTAQGARDAAIARAEGEAEGIRLLAQAQAEALALVSEQLAANPLLIQYEYIRNLSDNVGIALVPSNSPFLFDLESLSNAATATGGN